MNRVFSTFACIALLALPTLAAHASYADHDEARRFIADMVRTHGMDGDELRSVLDRSERIDRVIELIRPPEARPGGERSWVRYRDRFLNDARIDNGLDFWREHRTTVDAASRRYGVPPEFIVAIIGVETHYGRHTGNFQTLNALATLA